MGKGENRKVKTGRVWWILLLLFIVWLILNAFLYKMMLSPKRTTSEEFIEAMSPRAGHVNKSSGKGELGRDAITLTFISSYLNSEDEDIQPDFDCIFVGEDNSTIYVISDKDLFIEMNKSYMLKDSIQVTVDNPYINVIEKEEEINGETVKYLYRGNANTYSKYRVYK